MLPHPRCTWKLYGRLDDAVFGSCKTVSKINSTVSGVKNWLWRTGVYSVVMTALCGLWTDAEPSKPCQHAFCVSCVQQYFSDGQHHCPVCGTNDDKSPEAPAAATQPADGVMMVTYDNAFRLPGYETTSRGTIVVCYSFPPGVQKATQSRSNLSYIRTPIPYIHPSVKILHSFGTCMWYPCPLIPIFHLPLKFASAVSQHESYSSCLRMWCGYFVHWASVQLNLPTVPDALQAGLNTCSSGQQV